MGLPLNLVLCCTLNHVFYTAHHRRNQYQIGKIRKNALIRRDCFTIPENLEFNAEAEGYTYTPPSVSPVLGDADHLDLIFLDTVERSQTKETLTMDDQMDLTTNDI